MFIRKRALERIAKEKVLFERGRGGDIGTCLVYRQPLPARDGEPGFPGRLSKFSTAIRR